MTNIEIIDMANRSELAKILARRKWCEGCALTSCGTKECAGYIEAWMGKDCEGEENPPSDNESQQEAPTKKMTNGDKFKKEIAKKSNVGLAEFLVNMSINNLCKYCIYIEKTCSSKCEYGIRTWLDTPCEENPPADEPQEAIPIEVRVDLRKVAKEIVGECKEHYPNGCDKCRYSDCVGLCDFKQKPTTWVLGAANEATPPDMVNKPAHYVKNGMECIDFIRAIVSDLTPYEAYCLGNVVKYLWRFKDKNGTVDLDKAVRYIEFLKEAQGNEVKP